MSNESKESMDIIMQKVDDMANKMLDLIDQQLLELNISEEEMRNALKYAISVKMQEKMQKRVGVTK